MFKHLGDHLTALCLAYRPVNVVVTIDLADIVEQNLASDCAELKQLLVEKAQQWRDSASSDLRLSPLPQDISVVVQILKFETWIQQAQGPWLAVRYCCLAL